MQTDILKARSYYYEFFSLPLFYMDEKKYQIFQQQASFLSQNPLTENSVLYFKTLLKFDFQSFKTEQNSVLFDFSYTKIPLSASFYNEGRDDGNERLKVTNLLLKSPFRKDSEFYKDSEDSIGFIFSFMSKLLSDDKNADLVLQLYKSVINEFIEEFIMLLKEHKDSIFFKAYANLMEIFFILERVALGVGKTQNKVHVAKMAMEKTPHITKLATPKSKMFWNEFSQVDED